MDGMVTYIALLLVSLIAGIGVGLLKGQFSKESKKYISMAMLVLVFVLILLMGVKSGMNDAVISNLGAYGVQSLVITVAAIIGSIICAVIFEKLFFKNGVR